MAKPKTPKKGKADVSETPATAAPGQVPPVAATPVAPVTQAAAPVENLSPVNKSVARPEAPSKAALPKPTLVKSEARATVLPINLDEEIRRAAYLLSERRGFAPGHEKEDWLIAEHEVRQRYHQHSA
jgi:hypothetical protein